MTPFRDGSYDCTACGACCIHGGEVAVAPDEDVPKRLTRSVRGRMGFASFEADELRRMARTSDDACVALKGVPGEACRCSIYARRPSVCMDFRPGSGACLDARAALVAAETEGKP